MLSRCFFDFSVGVGAFVIGLSQISSFFTIYIYFWALLVRNGTHRRRVYVTNSDILVILLTHTEKSGFLQIRSMYRDTVNLHAIKPCG